MAKRLGADYPVLSQDNPGLIYCSISGFGQDGPWRNRPAHDLNYLALSGYLAVQTALEGRPWPPTVLLSDLASGLYAATLVLAQLSGRSISRRGSYIDLSITEAALSLMGPEMAKGPNGAAAGDRPNVAGIPHYDVFQCSDGRWFSLGIVHEDHFWDRFCAVAGIDDLGGLKHSERMARSDEIRGRLASVFRSRTADEWEERLADVDVPGAAVVELADVLDSPQFTARGAFKEVEGRQYVTQPARFSSHRVDVHRGPPGLNEHAEEVIRWSEGNG